MKLKKLISDFAFNEINGSKEIEISGICSDSRRVAPGDLFIARKGAKEDGHFFIEQAVQAGAVAVAARYAHPFISKKITQIVDPHIDMWEARLADRFYGHPSRELFTCAITGTKGKTTTGYLVRHLLESFGKPCGLIGTIEAILGEKRITSMLTTHDASTNHKSLREMVRSGCKAAVLEASSHGLAQGRVDQIDLDAAIFTKLAPDHLDYHQTMHGYAIAKRRLFDCLEESHKPCRCAIANADDSFSGLLLEKTTVRQLLFGFSPHADVQAKNVRMTADQTTFEVSFEGRSALFCSPLIGRFNVYNLLAAACIGIHSGYSLEQIAKAFISFRAAPGRLEKIPSSRPIHVFVDYAHNGDAMDNVLQTLREIGKGRIIAVFGAGGGKDPSRRAGMGRAADQGADISIITTDNPRQEDPAEIARQILSGFSGPGRARVQLDRKKAIEEAVEMARPDDIVLIAGKGHEQTQIFADRTISFDDRRVAIEALAQVR
jgi:UDP-N-acetylmuramoyl-L-alanyl-D-glutamate--2,6-diaminopimelate ligase